VELRCVFDTKNHFHLCIRCYENNFSKRNSIMAKGLMKQQTVKTYATSDDQTFTSKSEAVAHEIKLKTQDGPLGEAGAILGELLSGDNRSEIRGQLATLIQLSNMLDHKPRSGGGRRKAATEGQGEPDPSSPQAKSKRAKAEAAIA
jgi:hypothetical protein